MSLMGNQRTSVSALMGASIVDAGGRAFGRIKELAVAPLTDAGRVEAMVVQRTGAARGDKATLVPVHTLTWSAAGKLQLLAGADAATTGSLDDYLMLDRDLLDNQIIDVHGHKVVRVNDVDLVWEHGTAAGSTLNLRIAEVEVGVRGALRRLLKGLPAGAVEMVSHKVKPRVIPWDFVDLIDRDPSRRVRLKIEQDRLSKMHPSDLAAILEELAPKERQALFSSLDEEVAAEALEEVEPKTQKLLMESLGSERSAGIVEEMDPGAAADLLSELSDEQSDAILEEMDEEDRQDLEELLEYAPDSAAGMMTTEYIALRAGATVGDVVAALQAFEGDTERVTDVFVLDEEGRTIGVAPLARLVIARQDARLGELAESHVVSSHMGANIRRVAEQFDKYNLRCLPVCDEDGRLAGVVHAEDVIAWLRNK